MLEQRVNGDPGRHLTIDLQPGEYALVATVHGDFRLFTPGFDPSDESAALSKAAIALIAVYERLLHEQWVDGLILQYLDSQSDTEGPMFGSGYRA